MGVDPEVFVTVREARRELSIKGKGCRRQGLDTSKGVQMKLIFVRIVPNGPRGFKPRKGGVVRGLPDTRENEETRDRCDYEK